jgi:transcriptional regulator with XRE-family HTH domain
LTSKGRRKSVKVDYVLLGERIKFWRQQRNLTQEQLAEKIGVTPGFMSLVETGKKRASLETLRSICTELEITLNELLVGNQLPQPSDYNAEFAELISKFDETDRCLVVEITKAVCKIIKKNRRNK